MQEEAYIIRAELCAFLLQDPLEQISATAVLHNNTQKAISWINKATFANDCHNSAKYRVNKYGVAAFAVTFECLPECHNIRMFHSGQQDCFPPRTVQFGRIL